MDRASQPARTGLTDRLAPDIARINLPFCQLLEQRQQNAPLAVPTAPPPMRCAFVLIRDGLSGQRVKER